MNAIPFAREDLIAIDPDIMGGVPVFRGTRVPLDTLFDHFQTGSTIDEFLDDYPGGRPSP